VSGGESGHLIEEKQLGVIAAPDVAPTILELQHAADPLTRRKTLRSQRLVIVMKLAATIAKHRAARGRRE